jgi:hypothetical protein
VETTSIIKIEIDQSIIQKSVQNVAQLTNEIDKLKVIQKKQKEEGKELTAEYIERNAQIAALTKEQRQNNEVLKQANTITMSAVGSNEELRAQLSLLTKQYNGLSKEERENTDAGVKLKNQVKAISDELKKNEGAVGDNRRSVGSYKEAMTSVLDTLKATGGSFGSAIQGAQGFNTALKANPILAVVSLLIPLIQQLLKLDSVAEGIEGVMNAVNAAFKVTVGAIGDFISLVASGGGIISSFSQSFSGLGGKISEVAKQTYELTKATKQLEDARREQIVINAKDEAQIKNLLIQAKDRTKSVQERLELLFKASKIEEAAYQSQVALAKKEEEIAKRKLALADKNADNIDELKLKAKEAEAAVIELQSSSADLQEKIINRKNALLEAEQTELEKRTAERKKLIESENQTREKELEERKKLEEAGDKFAETKAKEWTTKLKAEEDKRKADRISSFNEEISLIKERGELATMIAENNITDEKKLAAEKKKIAIETLQFQISALEELYNKTGFVTEAQIIALQKLDEQIKSLKKTVAEPAQTLGQALGYSNEELATAQNNLNAISAGISAVVDVVNAGYQQQLTDLDAVHNSEIANINSSLLSEEQKKTKIAAINKKYAKEQYEIQKKQFETTKAMQIVLAIINTAQAVIASLSAQPVTWANVGLSIAAGIAGAAQVAVIASQPPPAAPSFAKGGIVKAERGAVFGRFGGRSHSAGGNKYTGEDGSQIEVERDEIFAVVNKRSSALIQNLSDLNELGGGVSFAKGGLVDKFAGGGVVNSIASGVFQQEDNTRNLASQLSGLVPVLVIEEFESVQGRKVQAMQNLQI